MKRSVKVIISLAAVSLLLLVFTLLWAEEFSSFGVGVAKYTIAIFLVWTVDRFVIDEVDTIDLIKNEPVAYAIFFFGNCLLAAACIASS